MDKKTLDELAILDAAKFERLALSSKEGRKVGASSRNALVRHGSTEKALIETHAGENGSLQHTFYFAKLGFKVQGSRKVFEQSFTGSLVKGIRLAREEVRRKGYDPNVLDFKGVGEKTVCGEQITNPREFSEEARAVLTKLQSLRRKEGLSGVYLSRNHLRGETFVEIAVADYVTENLEDPQKAVGLVVSPFLQGYTGALLAAAQESGLRLQEAYAGAGGVIAYESLPGKLDLLQGRVGGLTQLLTQRVLNLDDRSMKYFLQGSEHKGLAVSRRDLALIKRQSKNYKFNYCRGGGVRDRLIRLRESQARLPSVVTHVVFDPSELADVYQAHQVKAIEDEASRFISAGQLALGDERHTSSGVRGLGSSGYASPLLTKRTNGDY